MTGIVKLILKLLRPDLLPNILLIRTIAIEIKLAIASKDYNTAADKTADLIRIIANITDPTP